MPAALIYDTIRTPRGKGRPGGSLYEVKPVDLLAQLLKALQKRTDLKNALIEDLLIGCVTPIDDQGYNIAKAALLYAGWDDRIPGLQLNRYCASGLEAVNIAAARIKAEWANLILAGGVESMSRIPMGSDGGALLNDPEVINRTGSIPQGVAADLIATLEKFSRADLDQYALSSQQRAAKAWSEGHFAKSIIPVFDRNGLPILEKDEIVRPKTNLKKLASLQTAFGKLGDMGFDSMALHKYPQLDQIDHLHTAGNSSGIVDGASLVLIGSEQAGKENGLKPRARIKMGTTISSEPTLMLDGPVPAARKALESAGMESSDIDLWEVNEAFASIPLRFQRVMNLDPEIVNVNGGAIAMGHPLGATGAILLGTLLDELERQDLNTGLCCLCAGSGIGIATIIERI